MTLLLTIAFGLVAILYASVGFGGGSSYTAMLAAAGTEYTLIPIIALCCNLVVVAGNSVHHMGARTIPWRQAVPIIAVSVPAAWLGGRVPIPETPFLATLGLALTVGGGLLLAGNPGRQEARGHLALFALLGGGIGFLSGLVGIGGGIFLAPVLYFLGWGRPQAIAATASLFILCNSAAGLAGQLQKGGGEVLALVLPYWPLVMAVGLGGQIGARLGTSILPEPWVRRATALLILLVGLRLLFLVLRRTLAP